MLVGKIIRAMIFAFLVFGFSFSSLGAGSTSYNINKDFLIDGDSFVPIPWGKELPIELGVITGSWMLRQGNEPTSYFTFKVVSSQQGAKILYIQQMDPKTCTIMGSGIGNLTNAKIVYATLRNFQTKEAYRVNLRNFSVNSFVKKVPSSYEGSVVMLSIAPINSHKFTHFSMTRVINTAISSSQCREKLR